LAALAAGAASGVGAAATKGAALVRAKVALVLILAAATVLGGAALAHQIRVAKQPQGKQQTNPKPVAGGSGKARADNQGRHTDRYGDPLPPGAIQRLGTLRHRHPQWAQCLAFIPDGKTLVSGGWDHTIRFWDPASGKEVRRLEVDTRTVMGVAVSPDGKTLASAGGDGILRVWDLATGKTRLRLRGHQGSMVCCAAISPDGKLLASGGGGNRTTTLVLWDLATGKELRRLGGNMRTVHSVAFSPDGKMLAAGSGARLIWNPGDRPGPGVARLWDVATGKLLYELKGHRGGVTSVAFTPDGKLLASASHDGTIGLWDAATGRQLRQIDVPEDPASGAPFGPSRGGGKGIDQGGVLALAFSRDGTVLASGQFDGTVHLWDRRTGKGLRTLRGHGREVVSVAFSTDGKTLASGSFDHTIRLWDPASGKLLNARQGHDGAVTLVSVSPDGQWAASAGTDRTIRLWDLSSGRERFILRGHRKYISGLAISPDGKTLASGGEDRTIRLWDAAAGHERRQLRGHTGSVYSVAFSPDGKVLASAAWQEKERSIRLWDLSTGRELPRIEAKGDYFAVRFSPDGKWLGAYSYNHGVDCWELLTGKKHLFADFINFAFAPDGQTVAGWCKDGMVRFRSLADGREVRRFQGPQRRNFVQNPFFFSPDGRTLVFGAREIQLWETATGRARRTLEGHAASIMDCAFAPDGRTLLSGSEDTTVLVWDVARHREGRPGKRTNKELEALWGDLAGADGVRADRAIWSLAGCAEQTVPLLKRKLRPVPAVAPARLARLVAALDSDEFAVRDRAHRELEELGELAEAALRKALTSRPSPEARRRLERLLGAMQGRLAVPETVRALRGVEVLEHIGTPGARQVLAKLAEGTPEARLTREAKASLERLARRGASRP
jgi:WD40 repeat protein